ncbi:MAG: efflux RND transporter periplasmic adaptor subunit [Acidobacteriota bacterium]|nr:efflux RND transporter periplasmic adaptor subunit [Acidobacteriota bacterium]
MRKLKWIIVGVAVVVVGLILRYTVFAPEIVEVRTAAVERGLVEQTVSNTRAGTVRVRRRAELSPQVGGLVVDLPHREGDWVEAGEVVVRLDDSAQQAELESARTTVEAAAAQADEACLAAELAEKELVRLESLHSKGIASDQNLDLLRTDRDRTRAGCTAARAAVGQAIARVGSVEVQLAFTELRAPFAGTIAELSTEIGEYITPSPPGLPIPPVIDLLDPASIYVSAPIDEVDAERVHVGQAVRVTVDSRPDATIGASVERVAPYVLDVLEQNRTVEVEVRLDDAEAMRGVLPGTSADVEIILDSRQDTLRIPASAVAEGGGVLVLSNGVLEEKTVGVGLRNWRFAEVLDGLSVGDQVVVVRNSPDIKAGAEAREKSQ